MSKFLCKTAAKGANLPGCSKPPDTCRHATACCSPGYKSRLARKSCSQDSGLHILAEHISEDGGDFKMQNQVLGYESPLYGRRTAQFKIEPLTYRETAVFHPELSFEQNAFVYGITGGIPHYINRLGIKDSLKSALLSSIFDRSGYLFEEPENLLKQELREPAVYNSIITSVAEGASKMNDICTKVGIDSGVISSKRLLYHESFLVVSEES